MTDQDPELQAIRQARLAQLQQQQGVQSSSGGSNEAAEAEANQKREAEMRRDLLATVLDASARERLNRISLVNPSLSAQMENILLRMAQTGQLRSRVSEEQLIGLLEQASDAQAKASSAKTISFQRRKVLDDDDDFDL